MKTLRKISLLFFVTSLLTLLQPQTITAQVSVGFQVFYDNLSPYGSWISSPSYGYVWVPRVSVGFTPYHTNGYWAYTDYGWTWVSNYSWGWAPFHYGRWYYDPYYGWVWVPDNEWGPAWVSWRSSPDYYGWAPLGPGISIQIAYSRGYSVPYNYWTFVRHRDFGRTNINNYYVSNTRNTTIIRNTTVINNVRRDNRNVSYAAGPNRIEVQKRTGKNFTAMAVKDRGAPGQKSSGRELQLYRPQVKENKAAKPARITQMKDIKRQPQTNTVRNNKADRPSALPQRDRKETAPKVTPPKNNRPAREMERPRETAPKIREPNINRPDREVQKPRQTVPEPQQPRVSPPGNNRPAIAPVGPPTQRMERPQGQQQQRPNLNRPIPQGKRDGLPGGKIL
ncbi:DUF6600 domain-containing protein [Flavobacterium terrisoli]|uniref:DUF6600 domain-containing protein n=1 Tax=Flavobacterium terrisoli TaxID=3242195 RepID=UPI0025435BCB|nr:DUF6600 domain-containing protein [Flavobacterium buctense]